LTEPTPILDCNISISASTHFFFSFFSCRRRHTRFSRDWSSDVCSSDLEKRYVVLLSNDAFSKTRGDSRFFCIVPLFLSDDKYSRSEERRVGKERRAL